MASGFSLMAAAAMLGSGFIVALGPSLSSVLVASRSSSLGFAHGAFAAAGVVAGDLALLSAALLGLTAGTVFFEQLDPVVKYVGGGFLVWLGVRGLLVRKSSSTEQAATSAASTASSFAAGLFLTLADFKAIAFYLAFLPAFIDLEVATHLDLLAIAAVIILSVGGAKLIWAYMGARSGSAVPSGARSVIQRLGAVILISVGCALLLGFH